MKHNKNPVTQFLSLLEDNNFAIVISVLLILPGPLLAAYLLITALERLVALLG